MGTILSHNRKKILKIGMLSVKIAIGSSIAIYLAELLGLDYSASAGTIALLTLMATKWETVRISIYRLISFAFAAALSALLFTHLHSAWLAFGIYIFVVVLTAELLGWRTTISVNAVIGAHLLQMPEFTTNAIWNELQLVLLGIVIAIVLNLFHGNAARRRDISRGMRETEQSLQHSLRRLSGYLKSEPLETGDTVWAELEALRKSIQALIQEAWEYQENTFQDMGYYYVYLEMRLEQCNILANLHQELHKIRAMPAQALLIADYVSYMAEYVIEINHPQRQLDRLREIFADMEREPLPATRPEFESRAILYHVLMDLEDFLKSKERFVCSLSEEERRKYWAEG